MFNFPVSKEDSKVKVAFPDAVGIIKNVNIQQSRVYFEVVCFGNEEAYNDACDPNNNLDENAIVCRKHFNIEVNDFNIVQTKHEINSVSAVDNIYDTCEAYVSDSQVS